VSYPFLTETNFETGTLGSFDAEEDGDGKLSFPHYSDLARRPGIAMPYRGAYCMQIDVSGGTAAAYVQETGSWDLTAGSGTIYHRYMVWVDPNIVMATTNEFAIFQFWSSTSTVEAGIYINYTTANGYRIGIGEASASSFLPLTLGKWNAVETFFEPKGSSASTIDLWLNGASATQVGSFTSANITSGVLGTMGLDAGTSRGIILFDSVIADDLQIYPPTIRFEETVLLTMSGHAFVGPGVLDNVTLLSSATADCVVSVYDTDVGNTDDAGNRKAVLRNTAGTHGEIVDPAGMPVPLRRGCYITISGSTDAAGPMALANIKPHVAWGSDGAIRNYGLRRRPTPRNV
jgi:hypothetical protein